MLNFWHDIDLMGNVSRVIMRLALAMLGFALVAWILQSRYFAINQFTIVGDVTQVDEAKLHELVDKHLADGLAGGFFSMRLKKVQESVSEISWIKSASVRRVWPHEVEISLQEYQPIAFWNNRYLSAEGSLFDAHLPDAIKANLLTSGGPDEAAQLVSEQIPQFQAWLAPTGWKIKSVVLSPRYSWRVGFDNGLSVEFGRADTPTALTERAARLANSAKFIEEKLGDGGGYIDMRYPDGFAMKTDKLHRVAATNKI
jgi:cell division protein FtsQ